MKKLLSVVFTAFMVFAAASSAQAFSTDHLTLVVYNANDNEVAFDLGSVFQDFTAQNVELFGEGSISLGDYNAIGSFDQLSAAVFGADVNTYTGFITTSVATVPSEVRENGIDSFIGASDTYAGALIDSATPNKSTARLVPADEFGNKSTTTYNSIFNYDGQTPAGGYAGFNADYTDGEAALSDDYVDLYLYKAGYNADWSEWVTSSVNDAVIRINGNGSVVLNPTSGPSPVPVPGSITLLGLGLLGVAGIRRRR
nr:PEP-CTERM sorting domain-containing protein [uncultured Desulfobacter sp.]